MLRSFQPNKEGHAGAGLAQGTEVLVPCGGEGANEASLLVLSGQSHHPECRGCAGEGNGTLSSNSASVDSLRNDTDLRLAMLCELAPSFPA